MNIVSLTTTEEARSGFYPTPPDVADKLLSGIDWDMIESVLEPSAGKGNFVKAALEKYFILISNQNKTISTYGL